MIKVDKIENRYIATIIYSDDTKLLVVKKSNSEHNVIKLFEKHAKENINNNSIKLIKVRQIYNPTLVFEDINDGYTTINYDNNSESGDTTILGENNCKQKTETQIL